MSDLTIESIAAALRAERKAQRLTLAQVSERCGAYLQQIGAWEIGTYQPSIASLTAWAGALGFDVQLVRKADETPKPRRPVVVGTGMPETSHLEAFGESLRDAFGAMPYHVGSSIQGKAWRDVDVRVMLDDDRFHALFPGYKTWGQRDAWWSLVCAGISELGRQRTGLPVDFQIQETTKANEMFDGPRNPLFVHRAEDDHRPEMQPPADGRDALLVGIECVLLEHTAELADPASDPNLAEMAHRYLAVVGDEAPAEIRDAMERGEALAALCPRCGGVRCSECGECPRQGCRDCQCDQRGQDDDQEREDSDDD